MRIRATVAAVSGALALSALAVPAAQADSSTYRADAAKTFAAATSGKSAFSTAVEGDLDVSFSNLKIAKAVKVGIKNHVSTKVTYTLTHAADIDIADEQNFANGPFIYKGSFDAPVNELFGVEAATCTPTSETTADCAGLIDIYPADGELFNADAGTWHAGGLALNSAGDYAIQGDLGTTLVQRYSKLTVNASPEPVRKGKTITVTGKLSRANWEDNEYHGYTNQSVKLQFRKKGTSTYTTVKTIKTNSTGELKTTVTAATDGYFRYSFAGTTTTPAVSAAGDFVDVQ
ncbi:hypothetical protein [Streptomyces justiciae]|uniref:Lipoprotein n=1 Tax=Streptomyces justiciae TaxID=2780140 RepID=A0ABU3LIV8_9ACTN|nr:hypothetical protein [Streptomyces justiciae]MDT7839189.1 hypothetical protein [Streptomyces justiciae]